MTGRGAAGWHGTVKAGVLLLCFAACATAGFAATRSQKPEGVRTLNSASTAGWVLADFDGDRKVDFATSRAGRHDSRGYAHEVNVRLSASEASSFTFRSRSAKVRLSARDIDGDQHRDILILEALSLQPIGIWLNDGLGNFHEGDLADYSGILNNRTPASYEGAESASGLLHALAGQRFDPPLPETSSEQPVRSLETLQTEDEHAARRLARSGPSSRAPPLQA